MNPKFSGSVTKELVHIVDWYPTILTLARYDTKLPDELDGVDQWLSLTAGWPGPRTDLVYNINDALRFTAAIRLGKWKLIWGYPEGLRSNVVRKEIRARYAQTLGEARNSGEMYLFDLEKDPNETVNLASEQTKVRKKLMNKIRKIIRSGEVVKPDTPFLRRSSLPINFGGIVSPGWCKAK